MFNNRFIKYQWKTFGTVVVAANHEKALSVAEVLPFADASIEERKEIAHLVASLPEIMEIYEEIYFSPKTGKRLRKKLGALMGKP